MNLSDTIVAISSAAGVGARMILRVSGAEAHRWATEMTAVTAPSSGSVARCVVRPVGVGGWVYWFVAPRSYTGEDLVEFHLPGSPVVARLVLDELLRRGARLAEPGEFTARAFFRGRMDLSQAEGVAAMIGARSEREARAARQLLAGELARRVGPVMDEIAEALALTEVGIDFSDEDVSFISSAELEGRCGRAIGLIEGLLQEAPRFERLSHEPRVVLVGRPNAGKSTLLNALAGHFRAVVSDVAGTTRDALSARVELPRGVVHVVDVAGVEGPGGVSAPASIEWQMLETALREVEAADLLVLVHDCTSRASPPQLQRTADLLVLSKADLSPRDRTQHCVATSVCVSARTGQGMAELRERLDKLAFGEEQTHKPDAASRKSSAVALNARHLSALGEAARALRRAAEVMLAGGGAEVVAMELRAGLEALGGILGRVEDSLGRIFSQFCIGK